MSIRHVWLARAMAAVLLIVAVAAAPCVSIAVPYFLARWVTNIPLLAFLSILSCFLVVWVGARIGSRLWGAGGARFATRAAGVLALVFAVSLYWLVLKPTADPGPPHPLENIRYWQLPTGSRIAYTEIDPPAGTSVKPNPVVYLHGGPGARQGHFDQSTYGSLSREGFRVFLYDQAGSGMSDFLPKVRDYTVGRAVEDLEAVRKEIGADQMILVGHSWGSTLAAKYMSQYPGHVAKVILLAPGGIWRWDLETNDFGRTDAHGFPFPKLRFLAAMILTQRNPDAAQNLVSQREAEGLAAPSIAAGLSSLVCKGDSHRLPEEMTAFQAAHDNPGINPYVQERLGLETASPVGDPHEALRKDRTPAILLFPECNYLGWNGALDYRKTMSHLKIYYIPHAGHYIQFEQADLMRRVMVAFLLEQPDVIAPLQGDKDPRLKRAAPSR